MGVVKCQSIINIMEEMASRKLAESWDNVGLLIGDGRQEVSKVMVCLDVPEWVVEEAIANNVDMIIAHHPIIFSSIKKINSDNILGRKIMKLIKNNISVYCFHTNYDIVSGGLNDMFAAQLGFKSFEIIETTTTEKLYKLAVFVPAGHEQKLMEVMGKAGAGFIGNYSHCTFRSSGTGTFKPLEGCNPYIGRIGELENVDEIRLETIVSEKNLNKVVREMLKAHPYEEAAYDVYELENKGKSMGLGRLVELEKETNLEDLALRIKKALNVDSIKVAGEKNRIIKKAALINGAGNKFVNSAYFAGAQVLVTGDMQYHQIMDAVEMGLCVIDAGHFATEKIMVKHIAHALKSKFEQLKYGVEVIESQSNIDPVITI